MRVAGPVGVEAEPEAGPAAPAAVEAEPSAATTAAHAHAPHVADAAPVAADPTAATAAAVSRSVGSVSPRAGFTPQLDIAAAHRC